MIPPRHHSRRHRGVASATEVTEERHTGQWMLLTYFFLLRSKICFKKWCLKEAHRALKMFSAERIHHQSLTAGLLLFFLTIPEGMWVLPLASYCWDTVVMTTHFWCLSHAWSHTWHSISPQGSFKSTESGLWKPHPLVKFPNVSQMSLGFVLWGFSSDVTDRTRVLYILSTWPII